MWLVRLEAKAGVGASFPVIFVGFDRPADPPAASAIVNGDV
jgi:hypothetical protein